MMKILFIVAALGASLTGISQTKIDKTIPVRPGEKIRFRFDYPELIRVSTWDKNEISIQGTVSINGGEHDDAFILESTANDGVLSVRNEIRDMKNLPQRYTIVREGQKFVFPSKEALEQYQREHGRSYTMMSHGVDMDIELEIRVPRNVYTEIEAVHGMVEVTSFTGPLSVLATYGGVDAALSEQTTGELTAETNHGEIYTNLDVKFHAGMKDEHFHTLVSARPGKGPAYHFESPYGNVYLRKAQ